MVPRKLGINFDLRLEGKDGLVPLLTCGTGSNRRGLVCMLKLWDGLRRLGLIPLGPGCISRITCGTGSNKRGLVRLKGLNTKPVEWARMRFCFRILTHMRPYS